MNAISTHGKGLFALVAIVAMLALAPAAMAESSAVGTYGGAGGEVQSSVDKGSPTQLVQNTQPTQAGTLPFTGLDVSLAIGGGLLLIGVGAALAWIVPRREESPLS